jgi:hypothetical protein
MEDLLVLKLCSYDVQSALKRDDYKQAAMYIHSFLNLDKSVLTITDGDQSDADSLLSLKTSLNTLNDAQVNFMIRGILNR